MSRPEKTDKTSDQKSRNRMSFWPFGSKDKAPRPSRFSATRSERSNGRPTTSYVDNVERSRRRVFKSRAQSEVDSGAESTRPESPSPRTKAKRFGSPDWAQQLYATPQESSFTPLRPSRDSQPRSTDTDSGRSTKRIDSRRTRDTSRPESTTNRLFNAPASPKVRHGITPTMISPPIPIPFPQRYAPEDPANDPNSASPIISSGRSPHWDPSLSTSRSAPRGGGDSMSTPSNRPSLTGPYESEQRVSTFNTGPAVFSWYLEDDGIAPARPPRSDSIASQSTLLVDNSSYEPTHRSSATTASARTLSPQKPTILSKRERGSSARDPGGHRRTGHRRIVSFDTDKSEASSLPPHKIDLQNKTGRRRFKGQSEKPRSNHSSDSEDERGRTSTKHSQRQSRQSTALQRSESPIPPAHPLRSHPIIPIRPAMEKPKNKPKDNSKSRPKKVVTTTTTTRTVYYDSDSENGASSRTTSAPKRSVSYAGYF